MCLYYYRLVVDQSKQRCAFEIIHGCHFQELPSSVCTLQTMQHFSLLMVESAIHSGFLLPTYNVLSGNGASVFISLQMFGCSYSSIKRMKQWCGCYCEAVTGNAVSYSDRHRSARHRSFFFFLWPVYQFYILQRCWSQTVCRIKLHLPLPWQPQGPPIQTGTEMLSVKTLIQLMWRHLFIHSTHCTTKIKMPPVCSKSRRRVSMSVCAEVHTRWCVYWKYER